VPIAHISIRDTFTFAHKLNLKELRPSDWLGFASSDWIASGGKTSDGAVHISLMDGARPSKQLKWETVLA
jgi:hypothetical protein